MNKNLTQLALYLIIFSIMSCSVFKINIDDYYEEQYRLLEKFREQQLKMKNNLIKSKRDFIIYTYGFGGDSHNYNDISYIFIKRDSIIKINKYDIYGEFSKSTFISEQEFSKIIDKVKRIKLDSIIEEPNATLYSFSDLEIMYYAKYYHFFSVDDPIHKKNVNLINLVDSIKSLIYEFEKQKTWGSKRFFYKY